MRYYQLPSEFDSHCVKCVQIRSFPWSIFSRIWTEYGEILGISPYSVRMRENTDQKKLHIWTLFTQCPTTYLVQWRKMTSSLPHNIQNFANSLSNVSNLQRWTLKENSNRFLCDHKETQIYLSYNCKSALNRKEWKHNSVLKTLTSNNFVTIASEGFRLYADIDGYDCPSCLFRSSRPQDPDADKY